MKKMKNYNNFLNEQNNYSGSVEMSLNQELIDFLIDTTGHKEFWMMKNENEISIDDIDWAEYIIISVKFEDYEKGIIDEIAIELDKNNINFEIGDYLSIGIYSDVKDNLNDRQKKKWSHLDSGYGFFDTMNEKLGYPNAIKPIANLIKHKLYDRLNKWLSRKGKFANYNEIIEIPYEEIEKWTDVLSPEFKDFPVEFITVEFRINMKNYTYAGSTKHMDHTGFAKHINKEDSTSTWIYSETPGINKAYKIYISLIYEIPKVLNSVNIFSMKKVIESTIGHEVLHVYEDTKNPKFQKNIESYCYNIDVGYNSLKEFLWLIYASSSIERRARVAGFTSMDTMETTSWGLLDKLKNFSAENTIIKLKEEIHSENEDREAEKEFREIYKKFGNKFVKVLREEAKENDIKKLPPHILKFKNQNLWIVLAWWEEEFKKRAESLKRKFGKRIASFSER
jgi:hypothetical protein